MNDRPTPRSRMVPAGAGRTLHAFGDEMTLHLGGEETGGRCAMFTYVTPPGGGPPPHTHDNEDEWFLVLDGRAEFLCDGEWIEAPVGAAVFTPRGVLHTFRNAGDTPLRLLIQTTPSGFEDFFARCAEEFAKPGEPDMAGIMRIAGEHGIRFG